MHFEPLDFHHKGLLHERLRKIDIPLSEYSFPNLYLFRKAHLYEVLSGDAVFIRGVSYDGHTYVMPGDDVHGTGIRLLREVLQHAEYLFPIPEEWLSAFPEDEFEFSYTRGEMDYLYTADRLRTYGGRHLHSKRSQLRQFLASYEHSAVPLISSEQKEHARFILEEWQQETGETRESTDFFASSEALKLYDDLALCGGIYYVDREPAGFILGEELNRSTFALHFAKARKKYKGIYQYMFNNFAAILPPQYTHLNFEQDLDKEPLRIAKSSYMPEKLLKKYRVGLKKK